MKIPQSSPLNSISNDPRCNLVNSIYIRDRIMKNKIPVYKGVWELIFLVQMCVILAVLG